MQGLFLKITGLAARLNLIANAWLKITKKYKLFKE